MGTFTNASLKARFAVQFNSLSFCLAFAPGYGIIYHWDHEARTRKTSYMHNINVAQHCTEVIYLYLSRRTQR